MENLIDKFKETWTKHNNGMMQLIVLNVLVFIFIHLFWAVASLLDSPKAFEILRESIYMPANIKDFAFHPWTLFTNFFTEGHGDAAFLRTIFNLLALYWFGQVATAYMGNRRFVALYVYGGIAGGLAYLLLMNTVPYLAAASSSSNLFGITACLYAVVVGTAVLVPNVNLRLLFLGDVPMKYIALVYVLLSFFGSGSKNMGANLAYLGGALLGALFVLSYKRGTDWSVYFWNFMNFFGTIFKPKPKIKVKQKATAGGAKSSRVETYSGKSSPSQDEVDAILDKISAYGYESLTMEEKQTLFKASQKK
jgi:membrane associated rhomboid family serine protease